MSDHHQLGQLGGVTGEPPEALAPPTPPTDSLVAAEQVARPRPTDRAPRASRAYGKGRSTGERPTASGGLGRTADGDVADSGDGDGHSGSGPRTRKASPVAGLDAAFLFAETPDVHLHVCGLMLLDPPTVPPGSDPFARIYTLLANRLPLVAAIRKRLITMPFNVVRPFWVDDPEFDVERHLYRLHLDGSDERALADAVAEIDSRPLRRDRPLWEVWLIDGLHDGRLALVAKMHHSIIDGLAGVELMGILFDTDPDAPLGQPPHKLAGAVPGTALLLGRTLRHVLFEPVAVARIVPETVAQLASAVWQLSSGRGSDRGVAGTAAWPLTAPRVPFNSSVSPLRSVAFTEVPLEAVKAVKNAFGVTVNDVVTAVVGGGLRRYLQERGQLPRRSLIAAEPVSVHARTADFDGTSTISVMFSSLATDVADPAVRLRLVADANTAAKRVQEVMAGDTVLQWLKHLWMGLFGLGVHLYSGFHLAEHHPPIANLILSDVPGPPVPLYCAGARLIGAYPLGPIIDGIGLNVTVLSDEDRLGFGVVTCPDLIPDVWKLAATFPAAATELRDLVECCPSCGRWRVR